MAEDPTKTTSETDANELPNAEAQEANEAEAGKEKVKEDEALTKKEEQISKAEHEAALEAERKRYGGLDSKLTEEREARRKLEEALEKVNEKVRAQEDAAYLRKVEEDGGDVEAAKQALTRVREADIKIAEAEKIKQTVERDRAIVNEAARAMKANNLAKEYELNAKAIDDLLECETPEQMENKALKMHIDVLKIKAKSPTKTDEPDEGRKPDISSLSLEERAQMAMDGKL